MLRRAFVALAHLHRCYTWIVRPVSIGATGVVLNEAGDVLLVRLSYRNGWYLPGGGVNRGEAGHQTLERELKEELSLNADVTSSDLAGVHYHRIGGKHDHVLVYLVRSWDGSQDLRGNIEIDEFRFFPVDSLPSDTANLSRTCIERYANPA